MKKIISLLIVMSLLFVGNIFAATSASSAGAITKANETSYTAMESCSFNAPETVVNGKTFTVQCNWRSNDNINSISLKSANAGQLENSIHANLTPRVFTMVPSLGSNLDDVASSDAVNSGSISTSDYIQLFDVDAATGAVADQTLGGTLLVTFTIADGQAGTQTLNDIYLGTYSDTITLKIVQE